LKITELSYNETIRGKQGKSLTAKASISDEDNIEAALAALKLFVRENLMKE